MKLKVQWLKYHPKYDSDKHMNMEYVAEAIARKPFLKPSPYADQCELF